jgi:hydroxymethylpyrimidine pyrophosphatase-like HAD family hydrolase
MAGGAMSYRAFATDFDGTIALDGTVDDETVAALRRLRAAGWTLIMVTGRELPSLFNTFAHPDVFHRIVAENGAVLYDPAGGAVERLANAPPPALIETLQRMHVPLSVGHSIVATVIPYEREVFQALAELGLSWRVIFNKDAVMILPPDVTKATGLTVVLGELGIAPEETVGVGDAENDAAFLQLVGLPVVVANAIAELKPIATIHTTGARGEGVRELIDRLLTGQSG